LADDSLIAHSKFLQVGIDSEISIAMVNIYVIAKAPFPTISVQISPPGG
jgi:hypothetical protein